MTFQSSLSINWGAFDANLEGIFLLSGKLGPKNFPEFHRVAEDVSIRAEILYQGYLGGDPTPAGKAILRPSGAIKNRTSREQVGELIWRISNSSPAAKNLEDGTREWDMKEMLPTSKRARRAKDGSLYLIIPFRHGTPSTRGMPGMPKDIYKRVQKFQFSRDIAKPSTRRSATGWDVPRWHYVWKDKLDAKTLRAMGLDEKDVSRYSGMHRMSRSGQTSYMTFRVLSQKSKGWIRPAVPGLEPLRYAVDTALAEGMAALEDAFLADVAATLGMVEY